MHYKKYKSVVSPKGTMNLYRGCTHGCIYCDSRSKCYQINHDFEDIEIKEDAPVILDKQLKNKRKKIMINTGSMCDPYMHIEKEIQYTRKCLHIINKYYFGVTVLTKSDLILRDIDILQKINSRTKAVAQMTLTNYDDSITKIIEPHVSTTSQRIHALKELHKAGLPTVVWLGPILPFINDTEENMSNLIDACGEAGVKAVLSFGPGLTLREGNREYFYKNLDKYFPGIKSKYENTYGDAYECYSLNYKPLNKIFKEKCKQYNIISNPKEIWTYLGTYEEKKNVQLSLF